MLPSHAHLFHPSCTFRCPVRSLLADIPRITAFPLAMGLNIFLTLSKANSGVNVSKLITPPMASLPYITELGPNSISERCMEKGSRLMTFCMLPLLKIAVFMRIPSTLYTRRLVAKPRIIGLPPPCWLF